jgi:hypothetical protein
MNEKPKAQKSKPHRQVSTMHSIRTFTVSRERQKPASSSRDQRPNGVDGIDDVYSFDFGAGRIDASEEHARNDGD